MARKKHQRLMLEPGAEPVVTAGNVYRLLRRIVSENGREYIGYYVAAIVCLMLVAVSTAFAAWIMRDVIDEIFYRQRADLISLISFAVFAAFLIRGLCTYVQAIMLARIGNDIVARYQKRVFDKLLSLGVDFFNNERSGVLSARINANIGGVRDVLSVTITSFARDIVSLIGLLAVMVMQDWVLSLIAFLIAPPLIFTVIYVSRRVRGVVHETVVLNAGVIGTMQEVSQGITVVKAFTMEDQLAGRIGSLIDHARERSDKLASVSERVTPFAELLAGLAIAGVIGYGGYQAVALDEPPGAMFSFITALMLAYDPARRLARLQVQLERAMVNARMIYELLDMEPRQRDIDGAGELVVTEGRIAFDKVDFSYEKGLPVLHELSMVAEPGKTTAIVGASGAGKSTIISLLQRFYDPESGSISIDGQDIGSVTKASLRRSIAYVSQQPYLFEGSIRDNIRYGRPDATDAEIEDAARLANADEFIRSQHQGYETPVGENGITLSGGQRQRLSIARAIVRNTPILLLDEATSALDNDSEKLVQDALDRVMVGRTTIVVAHRLSTVINADKIIVVDAGEVVETGTHHELLALENGIYARFYELQASRTKDLLESAEEPAQ